ncbi:hypothetical protein CRG98_021316 [Punica granatum]|uniref:Uncharacterized protein n=1 Tax=Punica granatum TaxID=22663 RepID=A0A2I0JQV8_PUNGR|nr:hypothetical protein CRG98_021316 [Punica granatum]
MRSLVGTRLPNFTTAESDMLRGSHDFLGVNYYTARYVDESTSYSTTNLSYTTDCHCNQTTEKDGFPIGEPGRSELEGIFGVVVLGRLRMGGRLISSTLVLTCNVWSISDYTLSRALKHPPSTIDPKSGSSSMLERGGTNMRRTLAALDILGLAWCESTWA